MPETKPPAPAWTIGDQVLVEADGNRACFARVEDVITPDTLLRVSPMRTDLLRQAFAELGVELLCVLSYPAGPKVQHVFGVLYDGCAYRDLLNQKLLISPVRGRGHG